MVTATNVVSNNSNAASNTPVAPATNAQASTGAASDATASGTDGFMQLLNTLLGDNSADAASETSTPAASATDKAKKDDQKTDATTDATPTPSWLLSPLMPPVVMQSTGKLSTNTNDETIDALTPAGNSATNALLAQSLKRLSSDQGDQVGVATDKQSADASMSVLLTGNQNAQSPLDMLLNKSGQLAQDSSLLAIADKGKDDGGADNANARATDSTQTMTNFQVMMNNASSNAATTVQYQIHSSVGTHQWANEVGNQLSLMVAHKVQSASLQLTPDNLGPVQVKIEVNNNQASVWFSADHPDTRTALEQSLPHLRELFASQGMSLMDAGVFSQSQQQQAPLFNRESQSSFGGMHDMSNEVTTTQQVLKIGLLDTYA